MAGPAHNIGEDEGQSVEKPTAHAIQHLCGQQPGRIVEPAQAAAQLAQKAEQKRLATERIGSVTSSPSRSWRIDDNGGRGEAGFPAGIGQSELWTTSGSIGALAK